MMSLSSMGSWELLASLFKVEFVSKLIAASQSQYDPKESVFDRFGMRHKNQLPYKFDLPTIPTADENLSGRL